MITLATLRARKAGFAGAFVALLCAAALVTACGVLMQTGLLGTIATERYAGTPVVVAADQEMHWIKAKKDDKTKVKSKPLTERAWLDASITGRLRPLPGAGAVIPEVTFPVTVRDGHGRDLAGDVPSWGHAWTSAALTPYALSAGRAPAAAGEVVLDGAVFGDRVRPGDTVTVHASGGPRRYRVTGLASPPGGRLHQAGVFFAEGQARRLAGHDGKVTAIGVQPRPGTTAAELARAVTDAVDGTPAEVYTGDRRGPLEFRDAEQARAMLISLGGALGGTSLLVAILVVVGTFALSIQQRQRELALLRAVAATPRQIRAMIGREALVVGLLATPPGAVTGLVLAAWLRERFVELGAIPEVLRLSYGPLPVLLSVALTVAAARAAAHLSARRTARIRPAEALADAAVPPTRVGRVRTAAGLVAVTGFTVLLGVLSGLETEPAATPVTFLAVVLASIGVALLGPWITRAAGTVLAVPLRCSRGSGFLAAANTRAGARRAASVVTPVMLAVAMTGTILFVQTTMGHAAQAQQEKGTRAPYALAGPSGVPPEAIGAARRIPAVTAATAIVRTTLRVGVDKYPAQGITPGRPTTTLDLDVRDGSLDRLGAGAVALSDTAADHRGARVGDTVPITLGDGVETTARLVAIYRRGLGFGDVTLPFAQVAGHVDDPRPRTVLVAARPGVRSELAELAAGRPGVRLLDSGAMRDRRQVRQEGSAQVNLAAMGLIIAFTAIALVNTLAMATGDRAHELALLRLTGATRRQVLRMLRMETLTLVVTGAVLGGAAAAGTLTAFAAGMAGAPPYAPPLTCLAILAVVTALALAATAVPARVALRRHPAGTGASG